MIAGSVLFVLQLLLSGWLVVRVNYNIWAILLALLELAGGVASAAYLKYTHGLLIQSQILFQLAFGVLLIYTQPRLQRALVTPVKVAGRD